jgi:predicted secreted protein
MTRPRQTPWREVLGLVVLLSLLSLLAPLAMQGCQATTATTAAALTAADDGAHVTLARGGMIVLRLEASLGAGYVWNIVPNEKIKLRDGYPKVSGGGMPGAKQTMEFCFDASGSTELQLVYDGPSTPAVRKFHVFVEAN